MIKFLLNKCLLTGLIVACFPLDLQYELYLRAFYKLSSYKKIETLDEELQYSNLVKSLLDDHKDVVTSLAKAVQQVKSQVPVSDHVSV